jgi:hypothetical protein
MSGIEKIETESNLVRFAHEELTRAKLFDKDADYGGEVAKGVMELVQCLARQRHSGGSHGLTMALFTQVANYRPLTPLTSDPSEWMDVSEASGTAMWQSRRSPTVFSKDGGQTWYDLDAQERLGA